MIDINSRVVERFLAERARRRSNKKRLGTVGSCKSCGKPDPIPWTLFCRRRKCLECSLKVRDKLILSIVSIQE